MRPAARTAVTLFAATLGLALAQGDYNRARVQGLLPQNGQGATMLLWTRQPQVEVISQRIAQAGRLDPAWFRAYFASVSPGAAPPYDARLNEVGVSPQDYQLWLTFRSRVSLTDTGRQVRLNVVRSGNRVIFSPSPGTEALSGLSLDLASGELRTPEGFSGKPHAVQVNAANDAFGIGARSGYGWAVQGSNPRTQNAIRANLTLVQLSDGGVLLSYNRVSILAGRTQPEVALNLRYQK